MFVKVCGLKTTEQIDRAIEFGYDAIGVVTYKKSIRYCQPSKATSLADYARGKIKTFVVGVNWDDVKEAASAFDYSQIYEPKQVPRLAFCSQEKPPKGLKYAYYFYDPSLGSGDFKEIPEWVREMASESIIAGGLTAANVGSVIQQIDPLGVDVSSGVETDGVKDTAKMKAFIDSARACSQL